VVPDVWKMMVPSPSLVILEEDETTFLKNAEHHPPNNTKSQLIRHESSRCIFFT
jgi:hypothetical protein